MPAGPSATALRTPARTPGRGLAVAVSTALVTLTFLAPGCGPGTTTTALPQAKAAACTNIAVLAFRAKSGCTRSTNPTITSSSVPTISVCPSRRQSRKRS